MARLLDCFSPFIAFGLGLDASIAAGRPTLPHDDAQREALRLLDIARADARDAGASATQIESAAFAMVAWLDEILGRHPDAVDGAAPLQVQLFNSNNAHSEFFHHLSALGAHDHEVREVYWHALAHGFKGQYYFESGDEGELGKLKDLHGRQLQPRPAELEGLAQEGAALPPHDVRDLHDPRGLAALRRRRRDRTLRRTAAALAVLLPSLVLLWLWQAGPPAADTALTQRIDQQLASYACADLEASIDADGRPRVTGFVSQRDDLLKVADDVAAIPGVRAPHFNIGLRVWPHCEVFAILKPSQARNRQKKHGLSVSAPSAIDGRLREGDAVRVQVVAPHHESYIWVDYFTADGSVMHLNTGPAPTRLRAGESLELGRDIPSSWLVSPPFGNVMITVLSAPMPFSETSNRPPYEMASAYLLRLREALAASKNSERLIADLISLETVAR
ncbi:DotU family type IV/VI secretion system protein [Variovorax sp. 38R]|uniref:DotU family type IV/VI secretion system protein n=1 Tax=Variovorax sp. 38R TaxID=2774875 RepID=UPI00178554CD|nr:DotU family type IV/VI secretion system protein [Variovorax sp. 38R]QOF79160.1 DotU family type IV/VI secretion system protein [Variovorax sp. 38R]